MKFKTVAEAFNFYKDQDNATLEKRAQEVNGIIDTDPACDINELKIELQGIKAAADNNAEKAAPAMRSAALNIVTGMATAAKTFTADTVFDTPEYRSAFYKTMLGQSLNEDEKNAYNVGMAESEKRADVFTSSTQAAAVLPTQTLNEIIVKARTMGGLISECRSFNMPTKIAIPVATPGTAAAWHTEGAEVAGEQVTPVTVTFDGYEIIKIFSISAKVRKMAIAAFEAYLTDELTNCVMACVADALVNGTGNNQGTGVVSGITWDATNSITVAKASTLAYADVVSAVALLKRGYAQGAKWAMNNAMLYNSFYGMVDGNKRPIFIADPKGESIGKILGFDVIIDDNLPADTAVLGNYKQYMGYNMPDGIAIEASTQSSFKKGLIDYRALAIADCKPIVTEAFVKIGKATA
jgi:HK97 family phage major capsid protein